MGTGVNKYVGGQMGKATVLDHKKGVRGLIK